MRVINFHGTSNKRCNCGSWLAHWKHFSEQTVYNCIVIDCNNKVEVGRHVKKISIMDDNWYIVPVCSDCNNSREETLDISESVMLVPARMTRICGG